MKIPDKYDEESYIKGFKKGWGDCLGVIIGLVRSPEEMTLNEGELKEIILSKHPYHSLRKKANEDGKQDEKN